MQTIKRVILAVTAVFIAYGLQAQVPDTDSFDLDTVVKIIKPTENSLWKCHDEADPDGYDPNYVGDTNSLYSFRNYDHNPQYEDYEYLNANYDNWMLIEYGSDWSNVQNAGTADESNSTTYRVSVNQTDPSSLDAWEVRRTFWTFDLSDIPSDAQFKSAELRVKITDTTFLPEEVEKFGFRLYAANYDSSLTADDFDSWDESVLLFDLNDTRNSIDDPDIELEIVKTTDNNDYDREQWFESNFGKTDAQVCVADYQDEDDRPDYSDGRELYHDFTIWRSGECQLSEDVCEPELKITYEQ